MTERDGWLEVLVCLDDGDILSSRRSPATAEEITQAKELVNRVLGGESSVLTIEIDEGKEAFIPAHHIRFVTMISSSTVVEASR